MDPHQQQLNQLDPKLKEAYEKVMGKGNPPANTNLQPNIPTTNENPNLANINPIQAPEPASQATTGPWAPPVQPGLSTPPPAFQPKPVGTLNTNPLSAHGFVAKKKNTVSPAIIVIGTIVFLVVYTLFWMKFFGINIPFLP